MDVSGRKKVGFNVNCMGAGGHTTLLIYMSYDHRLPQNYMIIKKNEHIFHYKGCEINAFLPLSGGHFY